MSYPVIYIFRLQYAGENFVRHTGDVREFAKEQSKFVLVSMI